MNQMSNHVKSPQASTCAGRFVASWEPKPSRMMSLNLTDGFQTFTAVEHKTNSKLFR